MNFGSRCDEEQPARRVAGEVAAEVCTFFGTIIQSQPLLLLILQGDHKETNNPLCADFLFVSILTKPEYFFIMMWPQGCSQPRKGVSRCSHSSRRAITFFPSHESVLAASHYTRPGESRFYSFTLSPSSGTTGFIPNSSRILCASAVAECGSPCTQYTF